MYSSAAGRTTAVREFVHADVMLLNRIEISMRFHVFTNPALPWTGDGSFRRSPLVEFGVEARTFALKTLCRVGRAWHGRAVAWRSGEPFQNGAC